MLDEELAPLVAVTYRCPMTSTCGYCYTRGLNMPDITPEDFEKIVTWFRELLSIKEVTLLGGEPTQYPALEKLLDILFTHSLTARIYTNGFYGERVRELLARHPALRYVCFHYDSRYDTQPGYTNALESNMESVAGTQKEGLLRYNFHTRFEEGRLLELARRFRMGIAYSITSPTPQFGDYFHQKNMWQAGRKLLSFFDRAIKQNTRLLLARALPMCTMSDEEWERYREPADLKATCSAIADVTVNPDLTLQLCAVMSGCKTAPVRSKEELRVALAKLEQLEVERRTHPSFRACTDCVKADQCQGGCLAYKDFGDGE